MKPTPLANIHMANEDEILKKITNVSFFEAAGAVAKVGLSL